MSRYPITRRIFATGIAVTAAAAVMRNIIQAQDSPSASPEAGASPQLLIRIESISPMLPAAIFTTVPEFSLFDDGSIYALGPQLAIYPPPILPNLTLTKISPEAVQSLVAAARTAGLDESRVLGRTMVLADAPTTYITFYDGKEHVVTEVSGLMILNEQPDDWDEETWDAFVEVRSAVSLLIGWSGTIDAAEIVSPERSIEPDRLQVVAYRSTNAFAMVSGTPNSEATPLVWPLSMPLDMIAGSGADEDGIPKSACIELTGDDVSAVIEVTKQGDQESPWKDPGDMAEPPLYGVLFKPLLPDQTPCDV